MKTTINKFRLTIAFIALLGMMQSVQAVTITTGAITGSPFCPGAATVISVTYSITGTFSSGNIFRAQLSDAAGSFASPTNIGSITTIHAGTISANLGSNPPAGTGYRIRVVSTSPVKDGTDNGTDLTIFSVASCGGNWTTTGNENITAANAIGTLGNAVLNFQTNGVQRATIDTSGNVGIGTTTPGFPLDIRGSGSTTTQIRLSYPPGAPYFSSIGFADPAQGLHDICARMDFGFENLHNNSNSYIVFRTGQSGYAGDSDISVERMRISSAGNVGIGDTTPYYPLVVTNYTNNNNITGNFINDYQNNGVGGIGLLASGTFEGIEGDADAFNETEIGVYGKSEFGDNNSFSYGVEGYAAGSGTNYGIFGDAELNEYKDEYAGFFNGTVYATGSYQPSDRKLKTGIQSMTGAMAIINRLNPSVYTYKTDEYKQMHLPEGLRYGLIADEVQQVLPGAVKKTIQPAAYENHDIRNGKKLSDAVEFNAINYTEMIPILIGGMKEQEAIIEKLSAQVTSLQASSNTGVNSGSGNVNNGTATISINDAANTPLLGQNIPNPAANNTIIPFRIPKNCNSASIVISEAGSGKIVTALAVSCDQTNVALDAGSIASGSYTYSLYVDGSLVDTKQMVLTK